MFVNVFSQYFCTLLVETFFYFIIKKEDWKIKFNL